MSSKILNGDGLNSGAALQGQSPMSSPDFAKIKPPRKLRSAPKSKGSDAEEGAGQPSLDDNDGGNYEVEAPLDEHHGSPGGLLNRRSPRVASLNAFSSGVESARPATRQRRHNDEPVDPNAAAPPPVKRTPGRPRKQPVPKPDAEADPADEQVVLAADGSAQHSGSAGGGQPARSGGAGTSASGPNRPPWQPTPNGGGAPMRAGPGGPPMRPGPMTAGPGMRSRPALPLLVMQPHQLHRADSGALTLPGNVSQLLSAGSIQVGTSHCLTV